jgi:FAD:protein FMN transferase
MPATEFHAMGSKIKVRVDGDPGEVWPVLRLVKGWFQDWETCLSRFRPQSELSQVNLAAGKWMAVSQSMWEVLQVVREAFEWTGGLVTPTILPALESIGYDRSFETMGLSLSNKNMQSSVKEERALSCLNWQQVEFDASRHRIRLPKEMRLDLGGFGKGWAADQACQRLSGFGSTLVDAGGDIALSARPAEVSPWKIGVSHPGYSWMDPTGPSPEKQDQQGHAVGVFTSQGPAGVAASGSAIRRWGKDGRMHHLIDPRTCRPAESDLLQVSVLAETALRAEVAAKAAFLQGSLAGRIWLEQNHLEGTLLRQDGEIIRTR